MLADRASVGEGLEELAGAVATYGAELVLADIASADGIAPA